MMNVPSTHEAATAVVHVTVAFDTLTCDLAAAALLYVQTLLE